MTYIDRTAVGFRKVGSESIGLIVICSKVGLHMTFLLKPVGSYTEHLSTSEYLIIGITVGSLDLLELYRFIIDRVDRIVVVRTFLDAQLVALDYIAVFQLNNAVFNASVATADNIYRLCSSILGLEYSNGRRRLVAVICNSCVLMSVGIEPVADSGLTGLLSRVGDLLGIINSKRREEICLTCILVVYSYQNIVILVSAYRCSLIELCIHIIVYISLGECSYRCVRLTCIGVSCLSSSRRIIGDRVARSIIERGRMQQIGRFNWPPPPPTVVCVYTECDIVLCCIEFVKLVPVHTVA